MGKSTIEWTHYTFNPWIGCAHVSPGCEHCYAETWTERGLWRRFADWRLVGDGRLWGRNGARLFAPESYWDQLERWNRSAERAGERRRVFVASMADVLENHPDPRLEDEMRAARMSLAFAIRRCSWLDFLLVTKRPGNWYLMVPRLHDAGADGRNVWLIVSAEDQRRADERIPLLLQATGVAVRGVSYEPALGPVAVARWMQWRIQTSGWNGPTHYAVLPPAGGGEGVDWVIAGSESGHGARPCDLDWIRSARDQCVAAGVPFFLKQLPRDLIPVADLAEHDRHKRKVGLPKLDGRQWAQVPEVAL